MYYDKAKTSEWGECDSIAWYRDQKAVESAPWIDNEINQFLHMHCIRPCDWHLVVVSAEVSILLTLQCLISGACYLKT